MNSDKLVVFGFQFSRSKISGSYQMCLCCNNRIRSGCSNVFYHHLPRLDLINVISWKHLCHITSNLTSNLGLSEDGALVQCLIWEVETVNHSQIGNVCELVLYTNSVCIFDYIGYVHFTWCIDHLQSRPSVITGPQGNVRSHIMINIGVIIYLNIMAAQ